MASNESSMHPPVPNSATCVPPSTEGAPPPPPPPGPPPPAPPGPTASSSGSPGHALPSPELSALCEAVYKVPILQTSLPELETLPEIDMTDRKEKDNEIKAGQMFMKKELI